MPEKTSIMNAGREDSSGTCVGSGAGLLSGGTSDSAGRKSGGNGKPSSRRAWGTSSLTEGI